MASSVLPGMTEVSPRPQAAAEFVPPLENGDRLTRAEFERRYRAMPNVKKAELIEGVVHMPSPVRIRQHGQPHLDLATFLGVYRHATPGVDGCDNATIRLDTDNETQPDAALFLASGGGARIDEEGYLRGAPELVAEVSSSTVSIDLGTKLIVYRRNGIPEYLVWRVLEKMIDWFELIEGVYERLLPAADGVGRSRVFPGLWLDLPALVSGNFVQAHQVLQRGLESPEHQAFVAKLQQR
jgi:Uma2 family endonuclease